MMLKKIFWSLPARILYFVFLFALIAALTFFLAFRSETSGLVSNKTPKPTATVTPTPHAVSRTNGEFIAVGRENRHPIAVAIENHTDARPLAGLTSADIIYEALTEGNISRFLAIYANNDVKLLGPVRSARTYFIDWNWEYDGFYAHCGGNEDALKKIRNEGVKDLDEFWFGNYYWRDYELGKYAPHNLFTSTEKLWQAAKDQGWNIEDASFESWEFKDEDQTTRRPDDQGKKKETVGGVGIFAPTDTPTPTATPVPPAQTIYINYSGYPAYSPKYIYNLSTNSYDKYDQTGELYKDLNNDKPVSPKNLVVQYVDRWFLADYENGWAMQTTGSGKAIFFIDGKRIDGRWEKQDQKSRTQFFDNSGNKIRFNPGQIFINIVPPDIAVNVE
jgi:hypothetical protein